MQDDSSATLWPLRDTAFRRIGLLLCYLYLAVVVLHVGLVVMMTNFEAPASYGPALFDYSFAVLDITKWPLLGGWVAITLLALCRTVKDSRPLGEKKLDYGLVALSPLTMAITGVLLFHRDVRMRLTSPLH